MRRITLKSICLSAVIVIGTTAPSIASGRALLGGIKFDFWSGSNDTSVSHHQERPDRRTARVENCWYVNEWQQTRHGRTVKSRTRKCK